MQNKLTEDEVIKLLMAHLENDGWYIDSFCLGHKRGIDIKASKGKEILIIEAKGAKANDKSPIKKRKHFDSGQIKTHFGKAIVKVLEEKSKNEKIKVAIAQPDDIDIKKSVGHIIPFLKTLGINHFWVSNKGIIIDELLV